jgi:2-polyprenyl-3-methyl-5-hydroxy-6-metoxy-1,4-benzoquinol methylase
MPHGPIPYWIAYLLANPLRNLVEHPKKILAPHVKPGMTVMDLGCGLGFFSIPMARLTGSAGKVICVDVRERFLKALVKRARKKGVDDIVQPHLCREDSLNLGQFRQSIDFAFALAVLHEVPNQKNFLEETSVALRSGGACFLAEPKHHVSDDELESTLKLAEKCGYRRSEPVRTSSSRGALLVKAD